jgi:hypothetical protein
MGILPMRFPEDFAAWKPVPLGIAAILTLGKALPLPSGILHFPPARGRWLDIAALFAGDMSAPNKT